MLLFQWEASPIATSSIFSSVYSTFDSPHTQALSENAEAVLSSVAVPQAIGWLMIAHKSTDHSRRILYLTKRKLPSRCSVRYYPCRF